MATIAKTTGAVTLLALAFCAGALTAVGRDWSTSEVSVSLVNESATPVQSFAVRFATCGNRGAIVGDELAPGQSKTIHFSVCGEGSYTLEAEFSGGRHVEGTERYIESNYRTVEIITEDGIKSSQHTYGL